MCMNALPTFVNLRRRGVNLCEICPAYGKEPESILHALFRCEVARGVWRCWVDSPVDLLNVNMDVTNIAMQTYEFACSQHLALTKKKWTVPPLGVFKINVDGATSEYERNSSVGVVIRDATGTVPVACCKYLQGQYLMEEVKELAVECGLILAREQKLSQIILESDALTAVNSVIAADTNGRLGHVYQGILSLLSSFSSWKIKHVKRDYNRATH
ncbi:uncharacterized protein LOC142632451 [Castanea sativa]|uniref:uncharacterized protein LOC142632451 n=1 Tax=Castanea sativa TaxID=21020 RepID=UPI003F64CE8B